jgi:hypothetical protein
MKDFRKRRSPSGGVAQPQGKGVGSSTSGRDDGQDGDDNSNGDQTGSKHCPPRRAGVVVRAFVEHIGLEGDTELTVSVKWPASTFSVQKCAKPYEPADPTQDSQIVPGNGPLADIGTLYGETVADPMPAGAANQLSDKKR